MAPFVDALLRGDRAEALALSSKALGILGSRVAVFSDFIQPAQYEIGDLWYAGTIGVADEHRATAIVEDVVRSLPPTPAPAPVPENSRCLLAALGDERHVLGMKVLQLALDDEGWKTRSLGGGASLDRVVAAVRAAPPQLVALSAAYLPVIQPLTVAVGRIKGMGPRVLVGGPAFNRVPELWLKVGADGHGSDARVSLVLARRLLKR